MNFLNILMMATSPICPNPFYLTIVAAIMGIVAALIPKGVALS